MTTANYDWYKNFVFKIVEITECPESGSGTANVVLEEVQLGAKLEIFVRDAEGMLYGQELVFTPRIAER
jgi:hypothetical protein